MKRFLLWGGILVAVLLLIAVLAVSFFLDGAVKSGVEMVGSKLTRVAVTLQQVKLSLWSGSGTIQGLVIGNPEGYKTTNAISVGSATLSLKPGSLLSDKIVIQKVEVIAPEITFEGGLGGNNLSKILANVNETTGGSDTSTAPKSEPGKEKAGKKLEVDEFLISGAKVHINVTELGGAPVTRTLDDIHLKDLGTGPEGITSEELTKRVWKEIEREAGKAAGKALSDLGKDATAYLKDLGNSLVTTNAAGDTNNPIKNIRDLFKKK